MRIQEIHETVATESTVINGWQVRNAKFIRVGEYEYLNEWRSLNVGDIWARQGETAFIRRTVTVPHDWAGYRVGLELVTGGEGLLCINGEPYHGVDNNRGYILLTPKADGDETYECEIEIKTGGYWEYLPADQSVPYILSSARLMAIDREMEEAYYDFKVAHESAMVAKSQLLKEAILLAIKDSLYEVDFRDKRSPDFKMQLLRAKKALWEKLSEISFDDCPGTIFLTGHSHIDVAWLWPLKETARKTGRTYSTVAALMDEYPYYHFNCSQVPLFLYLKEHFPSVYERVKARVAEGRFEPIGGTWVEHDTNLISGESMVRQCLYGKKFFQNEFGVDVKVGWLPDVFGDSWALPQVYKKAGIEYFMTAKFHANETNRFPHNTFLWQGIDGTQLFTHIVHDKRTAYNATVRPGDMLAQWDDYIGKLQNPEMLTPFGWGDGGGGPTREMLEYMPRLHNMPGIPKVITGRVHDYFSRIAKNTKNLPVWNGEIYFERHRGTYTSQAKNKKYNRLSELLLREVELFGVLSGGYDKSAVAEAWQTILLNQFHDIIPGSSIHEVYTDSSAQYEQVIQTATNAKNAALNALVQKIDTTGPGVPVVVFSSLSWARSGVVKVDLGDKTKLSKVVNRCGDEMRSQVSGSTLSFVARDIPSCGFSVFYLLKEDDNSRESAFAVDGDTFTTPYYNLTIGEDGSIVRLFDRVNNREVLPECARANVLQVFEDKPCHEEAWDIDVSYQDKVWEFVPDGKPEVTECGDVYLKINRKMKYASSTLWQDIVLYSHTPRIDFITRVDWQERKTMLKAAFPVDIHSTKATYEIAFGAIERPTHRNTSYDQTRFEVSGHKWADLSEANYGVSVLNDCKYGWDIKDNVIRLTLLRSPTYPDPQADMGAHEFTYSLLPHADDWKNGIVQAGYELNVPSVPVTTDNHAGSLGGEHSFISVDAPNVIVDTVKQAEDGNEVIVRLYEAHGARGPVTLSFDRPVASAMETNLLEEDGEGVKCERSSISFNIKPFEIRTFKVSMA
ncbi:alpha-mannosidase [bacterium]|nr:alpha-mannosidase [bacterium]